jgi:hypothetical protein
MKRLPLVTNEMCEAFKNNNYSLKNYEGFISDIDGLNERQKRILYCIRMGMVDAFKQTKHPFNIADIKASRLRQKLLTEFYKLIEISDQNSFNIWYNTLLFLCEDDSLSLSFGIMQKTLNMSLKYYYNEHFIENPILKLTHKNKDIAKWFPFPVDSILLNKLKIILKDLPNGNIIYKHTSWSNWNYSQYSKYQEFIRSILKDEISLLEMEYHIWPAIIANNGDTIADAAAREVLNLKNKPINLIEYKNIFFKPFIC